MAGTTPDHSLRGMRGRAEALVQHWLITREHRALYFAPPPALAEEHLRAFSQAVWTFAHPDTPSPADFGFREWEAARLAGS